MKSSAAPVLKKEHAFLVDRMLGRLISWLRIFGYDTKSALDLDPNPSEDTKLIEMARSERRVLISRDRALVARAKKAGVEAMLVSPDDVKEQLMRVRERYHIDVEPIMSRCTACNSLLREAVEADTGYIRRSAEVPERLINEDTKFWICDQCGKVYWLGSHWRNIQKTADEVRISGLKIGPGVFSLKVFNRLAISRRWRRRTCRTSSIGWSGPYTRSSYPLPR